MTALEKMATNLGTILLARAAMILTPLILTAAIWIGTNWMDGINMRLTVLEISRVSDESILQDHESRLIFGKASRLEFQAQTEARFDKISNALDNINNNLKLISLGVAKLETIIDERVPKQPPGNSP